MSELAGRPGVVVGVDGSPGARTAVRWAAHDAELRNAALTLVHVLPTAPSRWRTPFAAARRRDVREPRVLEEAIALVEQTCPAQRARTSCMTLRAPVVSALVKLSRGADLAVVGCVGAGTWRGRHLGSVSAGLIYHAQCPVAVLHEDTRLDDDHARAPVVVGIDGSHDSEAALAVGFDEASRRGVDLAAVHVWKDVGVFDPIVSAPGPGWPELVAIEDEAVAERLAGWGERYPDVRVRKVVARDDVSHQLVGVSEAAQLLVIGGRGGAGFAGMLMGSVGAAVTLLARVPVIVARRRRR